MKNYQKRIFAFFPGLQMQSSTTLFLGRSIARKIRKIRHENDDIKSRNLEKKILKIK